jgi:CheY-like chemotaxis protein
MNILIIDDENQNVREIKQGLVELGISSHTIFPKEEHIDNISIKISEYANDKQYETIYLKLKSLIKKEDIDILFLDLNLTGEENSTETSGQKIIEMFANSNEQFLSELPIVVVSKYDKEKLPEGLIKIIPFMHIKKSPGFDRYEFEQVVNRTKLNVAWSSIVNSYSKIKNNENHKGDLVYIKQKLEQINYEEKLDSIINTIDTIKTTSIENNEKLQTLEIFSKSIIKTLPLLTNKQNTQKILDSLEESEINDILGEEFPNHLKDTLYKKIKGVLKKETNDFTETLMKDIKKEIGDYIGQEANFKEQDNVVEKTGKLTLYLYNRIVNG